MMGSVAVSIENELEPVFSTRIPPQTVPLVKDYLVAEVYKWKDMERFCLLDTEQVSARFVILGSSTQKPTSIALDTHSMAHSIFTSSLAVSMMKLQASSWSDRKRLVFPASSQPRLRQYAPIVTNELGISCMGTSYRSHPPSWTILTTILSVKT